MAKSKLQKETEMRRAVARVQNLATFEDAMTRLEDPEIDVNSCGASEKSALNFAMEFFCAYLLAQRPLNIELLSYKLKIIEQLLNYATRADVARLIHPDTQKVRHAAQDKYGALLEQVNGKVVPLSDMLQGLSDDEKTYCHAFYLLNSMLHTNDSINNFIAEHNLPVNFSKSNSSSAKPIILSVDYDNQELGQYLAELKPIILHNDYKTICVDLPNDMLIAENFVQSLELESTGHIQSTQRLQNKKQVMNFLLQNEIKDHVKSIDFKQSLSENFFFMRHSLAVQHLNFDMLTLRAKGMIFAALHESIRNNGQILLLVEDNFAKVIRDNYKIKGLNCIYFLAQLSSLPKLSFSLENHVNILEFEKHMRQAFAAVNNEQSFTAAYQTLKLPILDIDSVGASGKSALVFAIERFASVLNSSAVDTNLVYYKLKAIEQILSCGASTELLNNCKDLQVILQQMTSKFDLLSKQITIDANGFSIPGMLQKFTAQEKTVFFATYIYSMLIKTAKNIKKLSSIIDQPLATPMQHKPIIIEIDYHNAELMPYLLSIKHTLLNHGYQSLLIDRAHENALATQLEQHLTIESFGILKQTVAAKNRKQILLYTLQAEFALNSKGIDLCPDVREDYFKYGLDTMARAHLNFVIDGLKFKGMFMAAMASSIEHDGKIVILVDREISQALQMDFDNYAIDRLIINPQQVNAEGLSALLAEQAAQPLSIKQRAKPS